MMVVVVMMMVIMAITVICDYSTNSNVIVRCYARISVALYSHSVVLYSSQCSALFITV